MTTTTTTVATDDQQQELREYLQSNPHPDATLVLVLASLADSMSLCCDTDSGRLRDLQLRYSGRELHWLPDYGFGGDDRFALDVLWHYTDELEAVLCQAPLQQAAAVIRSLLETMEMQEKRESGEFHISQPNALAVWSEAKHAAQTWLEVNGFTTNGSTPSTEVGAGVTAPSQTMVREEKVTT